MAIVRSNVRKMLFLALTISLMLGTMNVKLTQASAAATAATLSSQVVKLESNVSLSARDVFLTMQPQGKVISLTVAIKNSSSKQLNLMDYWLRIRTSSGAVLPVKLSEVNKDTKVVPANSTTTISYFASAGSVSKLSDLSIEVIKWDFNVAGYERKLGTIKIPTNYVEKTAALKSKTMLYDTASLKGAIKSYFVTEGSSKNSLTIQYLVENVGLQPADLTKLSFVLQTQKFAKYNVSYELADKVIQPNEQIILALKVNIPNTVALNTLALYAAMTDETNKIQFPIGAFSMPSASKSSVHKYQASDGYEVQLNAINRIPTSDGDLLSAELQVVNTNNVIASIPNYTGYFVLDGVKLQSTTGVVSIDKAVNIAPGKSYSFAVYAKIPYTAEYEKAAFVLTDVADNKAGSALYKFEQPAVDNTVFPSNAVIAITTPGSLAEMQPKRVSITSYGGNDYFYSEIELSNKELRATNVAQLGGYLKDNQDVLVPMTFSKVSEKIQPNGKVLYVANGMLPTSFDKSSFKFYVGKTVAIGSGQAEGTDNKAGDSVLVSPVAYQIKEVTPVNNTFTKINVNGYTLDFTKIKAELSILNDFIYNGINLSSEYTMERDTSYQSIPSDTKVIIEFVDLISKVSYSKEFALGNQTGSESLLTGNKLDLDIFYQDDKLMTKISRYLNYQLNIYTVSNGVKVLQATKDFPYFSTVELGSKTNAAQ